MIVSPGVALDHPLVVRARDRGCRVRGDIDLFLEAADAPVVGITGSNGKSTVTSLLAEMVAACDIKVAVGGNWDAPRWICLQINLTCTFWSSRVFSWSAQKAWGYGWPQYSM